MKRLTFLGSCLTALLAVTVYFSQTPSADALTKDTVAIMTNIQEGDTEISRIGRMSFAPNGVLLVADIGSASIVAIETGDTGPVKKLKERVNDVDKKIGAALASLQEAHKKAAAEAPVRALPLRSSWGRMARLTLPMRASGSLR